MRGDEAGAPARPRAAIEWVALQDGWTEARVYVTNEERKAALRAQAQQEIDALAQAGVRMAGNGFSPIVLVKGELNEEEAAGGDLLAGADGRALRAALTAVGWAPEDFCALASVAGDGNGVAGEPGSVLPAALFREALEQLDPEAVVLLDDAASHEMREAYADALVSMESFDAAMLQPGLVVPVLGRRVLALDGFERALADKREKQRMWAYLKQLAPLGAPY